MDNNIKIKSHKPPLRIRKDKRSVEQYKQLYMYAKVLLVKHGAYCSVYSADANIKSHLKL